MVSKINFFDRKDATSSENLDMAGLQINFLKEDKKTDFTSYKWYGDFCFHKIG